jgi:cyclopentanol dehydrogenase
MTERLKGKVVIITGAAHGMGAAQARLFSREGANLLLTDIEMEPLMGTVKEIEALGGRVVSFQLDCRGSVMPEARRSRAISP